MKSIRADLIKAMLAERRALENVRNRKAAREANLNVKHSGAVFKSFSPVEIYGKLGGIETHNPMYAVSDGGHLPTLPLIDGQMEITFLKPIDDKSWTVRFPGIWDSDEYPTNVELRAQADIDAGYKNTAYHSMKEGNKYRLVELHREKDTVAWYVSGLRKGMEGPKDEKASLIVHRGERAISDFLPTDGCPPPLGFPGIAEYAGEVEIRVKLVDLFDVYAYLAKVAGSREAEILLLSPISL